MTIIDEVNKLVEEANGQQKLFFDANAEQFLTDLRIKTEGMPKVFVNEFNKVYKAILNNNSLTKTDKNFKDRYLHDIVKSTAISADRASMDIGGNRKEAFVSHYELKLQGTINDAALQGAVKQFNNNRLNKFENAQLYTSKIQNMSIICDVTNELKVKASNMAQKAVAAYVKH